MAWARIDDGFDDHPKVLALLEHEDGAAAIGLWTLCLTWAHRNTRKKGKTPGLLPGSLPRRYLGSIGRDAAKLLADVGLWEASDEGWRIHDFDQYLPTAETSQARAEAGRRGAEKRWAAKRTAEVSAGSDGNLPSSDGKLPSLGHQTASKSVANDGSRTPARRAIPNGIAPTPTPEPTPEPEPHVQQRRAGKPRREDAERLCAHLADRIESNGSKRPAITQRWRDAARLMIDRDALTEEQVHRAIDWCQDDEFWLINIKSMPKLREHYDRLRQEAQRKARAGSNGQRLSHGDQAYEQAQALKAQLRGEAAP